MNQVTFSSTNINMQTYVKHVIPRTYNLLKIAWILI